MRRPLSFAAFALGSLALLACNRARPPREAGPYGPDWALISCKHMDARCFKLAEARCPAGYYFTKVDDAAARPSAEPVTDAKGSPGASSADAAPRRLPPQSEWGNEMYSRGRGSILVKCETAQP